MRVAVICDMHIPNNMNSPQYKFFEYFVDQMKNDGIDTVICLGDITAFGEKEVFDIYLKKMEDFNAYFVLGNSDIRNTATREYILSKAYGFNFSIDNRRMLGINTPYGRIEDVDRKKIINMKDGDLLAMHFSLHMLDEDSRQFITKVAEEKKITILHAHSHEKYDFMIGNTRVLGFRAVDPDKSIGNYPCITYIDLADDIKYEEKIYQISRNTLVDARKYFGISCVDNLRDVTYALEDNVYAIELRCNGKDWEPDYSLIPLIKKWRKKTNGYLSIHMPNLRLIDGKIEGMDAWYKATEYALAVETNGLTMHPPRIKKRELVSNEGIRQEFLRLYIYTVQNVSSNVKIGIENIHMTKGETDDEDRGFGYTPEEIRLWINSINTIVGTDRVGHTLDVGHARNNGILSQKYPSSRWYEMMGDKVVAYHIHQVLRGESGLKNHNAIENWFGPMIAYSSFLYCWENNIINHCPIFLEVRGCENYKKSIDAFNRILL